jgi:S-adenosylmethionine:tRNA ribosyltransferase-isomerase
MNAAVFDFHRPGVLQATRPPEAGGRARDEVRLLVSSPSRHEHARFRDLAAFLPRGAVLVVNRSAALPASLPARGSVGPFRMNVSTQYGRGLWLAEPRIDHATPGPLPLREGELVDVAGSPCRLITRFPGIPRLWFVKAAEDLRERMREAGEPIRYGYVASPFPSMEAYHTLFSSRPGSAEMPSAARPFTSRVVSRLLDKGVRIASVVLHTGVSSLELDPEDLRDPPLLPEPFEVPPTTAEAVNRAREEGRPVIAVGTSSLRALESARSGYGIRPASGFTRRFIHSREPASSADGLITGLHEPRSSHLALLLGVASPELVRGGYREAIREGYLWHEFGDSHLILNGVRRFPRHFQAPY